MDKTQVLDTDGQEEAGVRTCLGARRAVARSSKTILATPPTQSGKLWEEDQQGLTTKDTSQRPTPLKGWASSVSARHPKRWRRIPRRSRQTLQTDVAARRSGDTAKSNRHPQGVKNRGEQKYPLPTTL